MPEPPKVTEPDDTFREPVFVKLVVVSAPAATLYVPALSTAPLRVPPVKS